MRTVGLIASALVVTLAVAALPASAQAQPSTSPAAYVAPGPNDLSALPRVTLTDPLTV